VVENYFEWQDWTRTGCVQGVRGSRWPRRCGQLYRSQGAPGARHLLPPRWRAAVFWVGTTPRPGKPTAKAGGVATIPRPCSCWSHEVRSPRERHFASEAREELPNGRLSRRANAVLRLGSRRLPHLLDTTANGPFARVRECRDPSRVRQHAWAISQNLVFRPVPRKRALESPLRIDTRIIMRMGSQEMRLGLESWHYTKVDLTEIFFAEKPSREQTLASAHLSADYHFPSHSSD